MINVTEKQHQEYLRLKEMPEEIALERFEGIRAKLRAEYYSISGEWLKIRRILDDCVLSDYCIAIALLDRIRNGLNREEEIQIDRLRDDMAIIQLESYQDTCYQVCLVNGNFYADMGANLRAGLTVSGIEYKPVFRTANTYSEGLAAEEALSDRPRIKVSNIIFWAYVHGRLEPPDNAQGSAYDLALPN